MTARSLLASGLLIVSSLCRAGDGLIAGNSTDLPLPFEGSAWFLPSSELIFKPSPTGPRTIHYCLRVADDFGYSASELRTTIENVFKKWGDYLKRKGLRGPVTDVAYRSECDGKEDLRFYFGVQDAQVKAAAAKYSPSSLAFVNRSSYDLKLGWGRGFVWVGNNSTMVDWHQPGRLFGVLSHEVGHVMGCAHAPGTIMSAAVAESMLSVEDPSRLFLIDQEAELATAQALDAISYRSTDRTASVDVTWLTPFDPAMQSEAKLTLSLGGRVYSATLKLALKVPVIQHTAFRMIRAAPDLSNMLTESYAQSYTLTGSATDEAGHTLHLFLRYGESAESLFELYRMDENFAFIPMASFQARNSVR